MSKLSTLQLCPQIYHWINSYLADRSQVVAVGGGQSAAVDVVSGVPQGSVLGPLLFYIDDVASEVSPFSIMSLFADDIALYHSIQSPVDYTVLQADITTISLDIKSNRHLKLHANKCCHMFEYPQTNQLHHSTFSVATSRKTHHCKKLIP